MKKTAIIVLLLLLPACKAKQSSGMEKIKSGSREVAQGVKQEAKELAKKAEAAGKKVKQEVKTNTHR